MVKSVSSWENINRFMNNVNGDWRKSVYVTCSSCKREHTNECEDLLVSFDSDGKPVAIMVCDANYIFKTIIDKSECLVEMSNVRFSCLFDNYFDKKNENNIAVCPYIMLTQ